MGAAPGGGWALRSRGESCTQASTQGSSWGEGAWIFLWGIHRPGDLSLRHQTTSVLQDMVQST